MGTMGRLLKGYVISAGLFLLFTAVAVLLLKFTSLSEGAGGICLFVSMAAACLFLGLYAGHLFGKRGLLYGLFFSVILIAVILFFILMAFSSKFSPNMLNWKYAIPLICGSVGGILGANLKK